jgi:hypothetical protein
MYATLLTAVLLAQTRSRRPRPRRNPAGPRGPG